MVRSGGDGGVDIVFALGRQPKPAGRAQGPGVMASKC